MTIFQSLLLGLIEGLTEFIPVSSTAHMLVVQRLLGIPATQLTFAFLVLVQLGPLLALLIYFRTDLWSLVLAFFARPFSATQNRMAWYIVLASIPALVAGVLLKDVVAGLFNNPLLEASIRFFTAAALLFTAERFGRRSRDLDSLNWQDSLIIGLFQVLSVFPGSSRSGSSISGGMLRNFERASATRFAFLMSAPVMLAAGGYETLSVLRQHILSSILLPVLAAALLAGLIGWLSIRWLINYVSRHSLAAFAGYCAVLGIFCLVWLWI